ncbi:mechanosensitive ion channel [Neolewinella lacunae]|uniref:Mechanosensitive ion channel n=1 Tax=Neolewinella lacunae TaxID=1517758 RepID=A0A923PML5_9BACT|nr:mechanosensitive ion channel domain-containing protein [Neolewinella lacunae]MBC6995210.1 mechanosensitive ion channel [Neolewinella lacunae]MDN3635481.1 mechanosensitive ion channel [Neolewinella lacunae]
MLKNLFYFAELLLIALLVYLKYYSAAVSNYLADHTEVRTVFSFIFFVAVVDFVRRSFSRWYARQHRLNPNQKANFQYGLDNIAKLLIGMGLIVSLFAFFGVDIHSLLTSLSIVAAAIAIISKDYISDFVVGIYFSFSKDFEINDYVKLGEHKGKITELQMLKIKILNDDDDSVVIPNGKIYNNEIINYTKRDIRLMSIDFQININNVGNIETLEDELIESLTMFGEFIESHSFNLKIVEMKKDSIDFKFQYTLKRLDQELQRQIRRKTVRQVFSHIAGRLVVASKESPKA